MSDKTELKGEKKPISAAGEGIRSMKSTYAFRLINYELYAKPSEFFCDWLYFS